MGQDDRHPWSLSSIEFRGDFYFQFSASLRLAIAFVHVRISPFCGSLLEHKSFLNSRLLLLPLVGPKHCHCFWWTRDNFILSNKHETKRKRHKQQSLCEARSAIAPHRISCHSLLLRCCSDQFPTPCTAEQRREEEKRNGSEFRTTKRLLSVDEKMIISHNLNFNLVWTVAAKASSLVSRNFFASRRIQFYEFLFDAYTFKSALIGAARVSSSLCQTKSKRDRQRTQSASEDKNKVINSHRTFNEWFVQL